jgi:FAD-dependent urate hydroxylase
MAMSPIHTLAHLPTWHRDRMIVIGDAAHAPSPTSGQGASLSVEDAVVLAQCLRDQNRHRRPRSPRSPCCAGRGSRRSSNGPRINNNKIAGPVGRLARDAMLPPILKMTADSKALRETFDYHLDWDAPTHADHARS